jgi:hypothetical protein
METLQKQNFKFNLEYLKTEFLLFQKLLYKSKNQHKPTFYYKRLISVKRHLQRIISFHSTMTDCVTLDNLILIYKLMRKTKNEVLVAYSSCRAVVKQSYFMALLMAFMGVLGRLHFYVNKLMGDVNDFYMKECRKSEFLQEQYPITLNDLEETDATPKIIEYIDLPEISQPVHVKPLGSLGKLTSTLSNEIDDIFANI